MLLAYVVLGVVTGLSAAGEAVFLYCRLRRRPCRRACDWLRANRRLLLSDVVFGLALTVGVIVASPGRGWVLLAAIALAATHGFRLWEHMAERPEAFAFNFALASMNALKLFGALALLAVAGRLPS